MENRRWVWIFVQDSQYPLFLPNKMFVCREGGEMLPAEDVQEDVWSNQAACSGGMKHEKGLSPLGKPQGQHGQQAPG